MRAVPVPKFVRQHNVYRLRTPWQGRWVLMPLHKDHPRQACKHMQNKQAELN